MVCYGGGGDSGMATDVRYWCEPTLTMDAYLFTYAYIAHTLRIQMKWMTSVCKELGHLENCVTEIALILYFKSFILHYF